MSDDFRRTGRTTRALERSVEMARKHGKAVYIVPSISFESVASSILLAMPGVSRKRRLEYDVDGKGMIVLMPYSDDVSDRLRGMDCIDIQYDHAVWETRMAR